MSTTFVNEFQQITGVQTHQQLWYGKQRLLEEAAHPRPPLLVIKTPIMVCLLSAPTAAAAPATPGSGYMLACFGLMVGRLGRVIGVERHERLVSLAVWNIAKTHLALLRQEGGNVEVHLGNALEGEGSAWTAQGPTLPPVLRLLRSLLSAQVRLLLCSSGQRRGRL